MRVLLVSAADLRGGAAKVAHTLAAGLNERGVAAELHARHCASGSPFVRPIPAGGGGPGKRAAARLLHRFGTNALNLHCAFPFSLGRRFVESFDIVHLHDPPDNFNFAALPWLARLRPVVWTLHCMLPFTGGCLYSYDCGRFAAACGRCPQFGRWPMDWMHRDGSRAVNLCKRALFSLADIVPVGVSEWILRESQRGMLGRHAGAVIHNPVDLEILRPRDRAEAKAALGIPPDRFTVMFAVAGNLKDRRKGLDTILAALPLLRDARPFLLPTGVTEPDEAFHEAMRAFDGLPPRHLRGDAELAAYYQAADVVWHPTRADTSSLVSLEAMACATPVIAAAVGGVPEIVRGGVTGLLIPPDAPHELAAATRTLMEAPDLRRTLGRAGRERVEARHSPDRFIDNHIRLYSRLAGLSY